MDWTAGPSDRRLWLTHGNINLAWHRTRSFMASSHRRVLDNSQSNIYLFVWFCFEEITLCCTHPTPRVDHFMFCCSLLLLKRCQENIFRLAGNTQKHILDSKEYLNGTKKRLPKAKKRCFFKKKLFFSMISFLRSVGRYRCGHHARLVSKWLKMTPNPTPIITPNLTPIERFKDENAH